MTVHFALVEAVAARKIEFSEQMHQRAVELMQVDVASMIVHLDMQVERADVVRQQYSQVQTSVPPQMKNCRSCLIGHFCCKEGRAGAVAGPIRGLLVVVGKNDGGNDAYMGNKMGAEISCGCSHHQLSADALPQSMQKSCNSLQCRSMNQSKVFFRLL